MAPQAPVGAGDDQRQRFFLPSAPAADAAAAALLQRLIAHEGSMTRLCETLAGAPVQLRLRAQRVTRDVPARVRRLLPGGVFIERVTSLVAAGQVLTDNLVYVAMEGLDADLHEALQTGRRPIGHLMDGRRHRRDTVQVDGPVLDRLWAAVGEPDPQAMRCYAMHTEEGVAMLVCEALRGALHAAALRAGPQAIAAALQAP